MNTPEGPAIQELMERALAVSSADGCVVIGAEQTRANLRWAGNSLTTNGQSHSRNVTVISTFDRSGGAPSGGGTSAGVVSRAVSGLDELDALVRASEQAGRAASPAEDAMPLVEDYPHEDDWAAEPAGTDVTVFERFAPALGAEFDRWRRADRLLFGYAEHELASTFVATSTGLRRRFDQPNGHVQLNGKSSNGGGPPARGGVAAGGGQSAFAAVHTRDFADVDAAALAAEVERRLGWAQRRVELPAGRYETILPPSTVADLLIYAYWTASARDAEEGRSVFAGAGGGQATRIGEALSGLPLRMYSDPAYPGLQCAPFEIATASDGGLTSVFDNGIPSPPADWIRGGRLHELMRTRAWAARTGASARPGVGNLILTTDAAAAPDLDAMIAGTERGLLLTCLWYIRVVDSQTLLLTGLTRDGVYLVEDGAVTAAVNNFRFNESPVDLLGRVSQVGRTEPTLSREWGDYFSRTAMPALRVPDFNMSTVSRAS